MRGAVLRRLPGREKASFALVGAGGAVLGHGILSLLMAAGWPAAAANAVQAVVTLQLNFIGNRFVTWRGRSGHSRVGGWQSWRRFQVARGLSLLLSVALFPILAPATGPALAYWCLVLAGAVVNFCADKYWCFGRPRVAPVAATRPGRRLFRLALLVLAAAVAVLLAWFYLDAFLVVASLLMTLVAGTTLVFQLYKWWRPEHNDPARYGEPDQPRLPGVILVPMRHEEAVAGHTLDRLARLNHPHYRVVAIIDHPDDPGTARIAHAKARQFPGKVLVCQYPEDTAVHNKPIGLNAAVRMLHRMRVPFEWVGVADAEDVFHPNLLTLVDYRFRSTGAGIVQGGVQLMNFSSDPDGLPVPGGALGRARRWWQAHSTAWWRATNVLEYFKWFQSRLKLQAAVRVMPLGGNTVFFRRQFLEDLYRRQGTYWDEACLTEDCKIGILASVLGYQVDVIYQEELVTREETPGSLAGLVRQRVRWMQGFVHVFREGHWLRLPSLTQRVLAVYVLGFQFFQAATGVLAPVALVLALLHKAPVLITLLATIPLAIGLLSLVLDLLMLAQFGRAFGARVRLRDYAGVVFGAYPFQLLLSVAAVWAVARYALGRNNWVKTAHRGAHLDAGDLRTAGSAA